MLFTVLYTTSLLDFSWQVSVGHDNDNAYCSPLVTSLLVQWVSVIDPLHMMMSLGSSNSSSTHTTISVSSSPDESNGVVIVAIVYLFLNEGTIQDLQRKV